MNASYNSDFYISRCIKSKKFEITDAKISAKRCSRVKFTQEDIIIIH